MSIDCRFPADTDQGTVPAQALAELPSAAEDSVLWLVLRMIDQTVIDVGGVPVDVRAEDRTLAPDGNINQTSLLLE